jgi:hypothetical protein
VWTAQRQQMLRRGTVVPTSVWYRLDPPSFFRIRLLFHESTEPIEGLVPLRGNLVEVEPCLFKPALFQLPNALSSAPRTSHQAGVFHYSQMLRHRLARNARACGQSGNRCRSVVAQPGDQPQALLIPQGRKKNRRVPCVVSLRSRDSGQDIPRRP